MKKVILILFMVLVSLFPLSQGDQGRPFDITSLVINFDKTDAVFTVNYDLGSIPRMYVLLLGSKSIEPKVKAVFSNFDYEIIKMDQDKAILRVKNVSRLDKEYYLHDSRKFGESIKTVLYIYTPDSPEPKKYSNFYLFNWSNVPGNDNNKLISFLTNDLDINWANNAKILKPDDNTIRVFTAESSVEILLESKEKALLKISDGRTYDLQVIEDSGNLYIYSPDLYSTPDIYYRS